MLRWNKKNVARGNSGTRYEIHTSIGDEQLHLYVDGVWHARCYSLKDIRAVAREVEKMLSALYAAEER